MISQRERRTIIGITALAALVRLALLDQPMRFDEGVSWAYYVGRSWATIVSTYTHPNNHVLYSLLAKVVAMPVGYPPWALRLPAFLAGVAIVPLIWIVGRRFTDARTGLLAAALSVGSTELVLYSGNARGYTLVVALFLTMLVVADELIAQHRAALWGILTLLGALGLYAIPVMLYPLGVVYLWLALAARSTAVATKWHHLGFLVASLAGTFTLAGLLYSPIIHSAGLGAVTGNKFVLPSPWPLFARELPRMIVGTIVSWTSPLPAWSGILVAALALAGIKRVSASERPSLAVAAALWCSVLLLATHRVPFVRVWLWLLPLALLSAARGVWVIVDRSSSSPVQQPEWAAVAAAAIAFVLTISTHAAAESDDTGAFRPAEQVTALLKPRLRPGDRVLAPIPSIGPLLYYFPRAGLDTSLLTRPLATADRAFLVLDARHGQSVAWANASGIIDRVHFAPPRLVARLTDAEVWQTGPP